MTFPHGRTVNIYIAYEINLWNNRDGSDPMLENSLFEAVKSVKNADVDKYKYSRYGIGFDIKGTFSFLTVGFGKNLIMFRADMSSSVNVDNKRKDILVFGDGPKQRLDDTTQTAKNVINQFCRA